MKRYETPAWSSKPTIAYHLEVLKNGTIIDTIKFPEEEQFVIVGRNEELCTKNFVFEHPSISRQHAIIQHRNNGRIYIYDLGSTHHTFWNKEEIKPFHYVPLRCGDLLKFGESTRLYVVASDDRRALVLSEQQRKIQNKALEDVVKKVSQKKISKQDSDEEEENDEEDEDEKNAFDEEDDEELRHKKRMRIEDEINSNSMFDEDDEFFDRTKTKKVKKEKERVETHQTLTKQREKIHLQILELEKKKKELTDKPPTTSNKADKAEEEDDPLDAYMKEMELKIVSEDTENIDEQLKELLQKRDELDQLIEISKPAISGLITKEQRAEQEKMDVITQDMFVKKTKKHSIINTNQHSKPTKVDVQDVNEIVISPNVSVIPPKSSANKSEFFKKPTRIIPTGAPVGLVMNEELPTKFEVKPGEESEEEEDENDFVPSTLEDDQDKPDEQEQPAVNDESEESEEEQEVVKVKSAPNWYQNVDETKSEWTAPKDQKGDGKTKLNEKYGY